MPLRVAIVLSATRRGFHQTGLDHLFVEQKYNATKSASFLEVRLYSAMVSLGVPTPGSSWPSVADDFVHGGMQFACEFAVRLDAHQLRIVVHKLLEHAALSYAFTMLPSDTDLEP